MNLQTEVLVNSSQREYIHNRESGFPYLTVSGMLEAHGAYPSSLEYWKKHFQNNPVSPKDNFRVCIMENIPWHWHEELEFCHVFKGSCTFCLPDKDYLLDEGDAIFINANCLHMVTKSPDQTVTIYHTQQFRKELLEGAADSVFENKYLHPILENGSIQGILFRHDDQEQEQLITIMEQAYQTYLNGDIGYEFIIRNLISELWLYIIRKHQNKLDSSVKYSSAITGRIKTMMTFIEHNYRNKISVEDIGDSANVSRRECLRCFKMNLHMSPFTYLTELRIRKATQLLSQTKDSIITISEACGFSSSSYFGKVFLKMIGYTPNEYRKNMQSKLSS